MTLLFVLAVALASVPLAGGRVLGLADVRFRRAWLALLGVAAQVLITVVAAGGDPALHAGVHVLSYLLVGAFVVVNRHVPGLVPIGLGGLMNLAAIVANGGVMPASPSALRAAGLPLATGEFENSAPVDDPKLSFLGDVFATPGILPVDNVFSVGDLVITLGVFVAVHRLSGSRLAGSRGSSAPGAAAPTAWGA